MRSKRLASLVCAGLSAGLVFGLSTAAASASTLVGAGSTLVAPIEAEWAAAWGNTTGNTVTYAAVGSGSGESDIAKGLVDFGASDAPLSVYSGVPGNLVQIPWALTATGVSYHINGLRLPRHTNLHLTGSVLAQIYLGQITNWDSPAIKKLNKGASIPSTPIEPLWRSDSSGDTFAFTRYLSDVSGRFDSAGRQLDHGQLPDRRRRQGQLGHGGGARGHQRRHRLHRGVLPDRQQPPRHRRQERRRQLRGSEPDRD